MFVSMIRAFSRPLQVLSLENDLAYLKLKVLSGEGKSWPYLQILDLAEKHTEDKHSSLFYP